LPVTTVGERLRRVPPAARAELVGVNNLRLLRAGLVTWDDPAGDDRVRDFAETVRSRQLSVDQLVAAGIPRGLAVRAAGRELR
jgi:hypothetical protein